MNKTTDIVITLGIFILFFILFSQNVGAKVKRLLCCEFRAMITCDYINLHDMTNR